MTSETAEPQAVVARPSLWEDFVDIFVSPSEVFERRRDGRFGMALLILTLALTVLTYGLYSALSAAFEADLARGIAQAAGEEGAEMPVEALMAFSRSLAIYGTLVMVPLGAALSGIGVWLVARLFGGRLSVPLGITIATYAMFPRIIATLSGILQGVLLDPDSGSRISVGPARFLDPDVVSPALLGIASRVDLFILWSLVLTAIGLRVIAGMRSTNAYLAALVLWILGSLPVVLPAVIAAVSGS